MAETPIKHSKPCRMCGRPTYRKERMCKVCITKNGASLPEPSYLPEPYLAACAEELLKRHEERAQLLRRLMGAGKEAA
jgi:hypothetical protein